MGERLSLPAAEPVSRKPKNKGWLALAIAGLLTGTSPGSAEAGQDFNWGQFAQGALDGYARGQREREDEQRCLRTQIDSANELLINARDDFRYDTERANEDADSALESLSRRTDLTPAAQAIERRRIETNRTRSLSSAQSRFATARRIADERVQSCRRRQ
ncbi:MAG: hypothetical protein WC880_04370 [Candidatus Paceibacterota bacterium]